MKKQAEGASNGYKNLLEENESTTAQLKKLKELVGDNEDDVKKGGSASPLDKLLEENASLTKQLAVATKELKSAETKVDAVKKQAEGQSAAFMKLMDDKTKSDKQGEETKALEAKLQQQAEQIAALTTERDSLKSQVQDYDFMFADAKKKAD
jgi:B-cell receptor-associated protein 31